MTKDKIKQFNQILIAYGWGMYGYDYSYCPSWLKKIILQDIETVKND